MVWCEEIQYNGLRHVHDELIPLPCQLRNFWSSFAYILMGLYTYNNIFPIKYIPNTFLSKIRKYNGILSILVGIGSLLTHSCANNILSLPYTNKGKVCYPYLGCYRLNMIGPSRLDQISMIFIFSNYAIQRLILLIMLYKEKKNQKYQINWLKFLCYHPLIIILMHIFKFIFSINQINLLNYITYALILLLCIIFDVIYMISINKAIQMNVKICKMLCYSWLSFIMAFIIWYLDLSGSLCDITHWGHAIWHTLTASTGYIKNYTILIAHHQLQHTLDHQTKEAVAKQVQQEQVPGVPVLEVKKSQEVPGVLEVKEKDLKTI